MTNFSSFWEDPVEKKKNSLTVSSIGNRLHQSCVDVIADIDPLLEQETLVFLA